MPSWNTGTNTIVFIKKNQVPQDRAKDVTYGLITCPISPEKLDEPNRTRLVCVCSGNLVPGGSVVITQYQSLPLSPQKSPPHMCHTVVLPLWSPCGAFRRGFQRVSRSLDSVTRSDVTTWAMSHQVFIAGTTCILSEGTAAPLPLTYATQESSDY